MKPIRISVIACAVALGLIAATILNNLVVNAGGGELAMSPVVALICVVIAGITLWFAFQVARFRNVETRRKAKSMNSLMAARTLACAQGAILTGALLAGWMLGLIVYDLALASTRGIPGFFWSTVVNLVGAVLLLAGGVWAQYLCRIPPDDPDGNSSSGGSNSGKLAADGYSRTSDQR